MKQVKSYKTMLIANLTLKHIKNIRQKFSAVSSTLKSRKLDQYKQLPFFNCKAKASNYVIRTITISATAADDP